MLKTRHFENGWSAGYNKAQLLSVVVLFFISFPAREISLVSGDGCKIAQSSMNLDENFGLLKLHAGAYPDATIGRIDSFSDVM